MSSYRMVVVTFFFAAIFAFLGATVFIIDRLESENTRTLRMKDARDAVFEQSLESERLIEEFAQ